MEHSHDHAGTYRESVFLRRLGQSRSPRFSASLECRTRALGKVAGAYRFLGKVVARTPARPEADGSGLAALHAQGLSVGNRPTIRTLEELPDFAERGWPLRFAHLQEHQRRYVHQ